MESLFSLGGVKARQALLAAPPRPPEKPPPPSEQLAAALDRIGIKREGKKLAGSASGVQFAKGSAVSAAGRLHFRAQKVGCQESDGS